MATGLYHIYIVLKLNAECGKKVPLAPSWVIGKETKTVAKLVEKEDSFDIIVKMGASASEMKEAEKSGTVGKNGLICPSCGKTTPISSLRKDRTDENGNTVYGLRQWEKSEFDFRDDDVYSERLYAIKYEREDGTRYYRHPNERDFENENKVKQIVRDNIVTWQEQGLVPSMQIESGYNTDQVIRERGWTHWNHLFNARQLLTISRFINVLFNENNKILNTIGLLGLHKCVDWNSRLCIWNAGVGNEKLQNTYTTQALNTLFNYGCRSLIGMSTSWFFNVNSYKINKKGTVVGLGDARNIDNACHMWITDPPYADAVNYHELSELFLSWDKKIMRQSFPELYTDSKRILAINVDEHFSQNMIDIYSNLTKHMHDDGLQVVMFTHSDPAIWAQLALIMWKAGLKVTAAWNIATETDASGLKDGNYVKGTVLLVLRKQTDDTTAYLDEINSDIKAEVKAQIESMQDLEDKEEPNFSDPDYVLAAYSFT